MSAAAITVTTDATLLIAANSSRNMLVIDNTSDATVYIGDAATVTAATGFSLASGEKIFWTCPQTNDESYFYKGTWYGIVASSTKVVRVVEFLSSRI